MNKDIIYYAKKRYATKAYDKNQTISQEKMLQVKQLLRLSPSSTNSQPWHFIIGATEEGKARIIKAVEKTHPFNKNSLLNCSHVVVLCSKTTVDENHLINVLEQEERDGRYAADPVTLKPRTHNMRTGYISTVDDIESWIDKQVYLNLGHLLLGVSALGIDATPMEGFDQDIMDKEFGLKDKGYKSLVMVALGYHCEKEDYNAKLPKSRLELEQIVVEV